MAKNQEKVKQFLSELAVKLQPLWAEEKKELLELKKAECKIIIFNFLFNNFLLDYTLNTFRNVEEKREQKLYTTILKCLENTVGPKKFRPKKQVK